jgi:hypothetical protein
MNSESPLTLASRIGFQDARDYLKSRGWTPRQSRREYVAIFASPQGEAEVLIPLERDLGDYAEAMRRATETVAEIEERAPAQVLHDLLQPRADTLRFALEGDRHEGGVVGLDQGASLLIGARKALLASACGALRPRRFHPRMSLADAQSFVAACQLGPTEIGSFVLTIDAPLDLGPQMNAEEPFGRRASEYLLTSVGALATAIRKADLSTVLETTDETAVISSNLCSALVDMMPQDESADLRLRGSWSPILPPRKGVPEAVRLEREMYETIAKIADKLRPNAGPQDDWFLGTVAELAGTQGETGRVEGDVTLILLHEDQALRASAVLGPDDYEKALVAHAKQKYVMFRGVLHRGARSNRIDDLAEFQAAG